MHILHLYIEYMHQKNMLLHVLNLHAFTVLKKKNLIYIYGKILKNAKIHLNYLSVNFNDRNLPNNVH